MTNDEITNSAQDSSMKWRDSTRFGDLAHKARLKYMCA
jgi:hypothetical protein